MDFLPRSKNLLNSWLQSPSAVILEPKKMKSVTVSIVSPSTCHDVMGLDAMILGFWMLNSKPAFSLSSFTLIKRLFSSSPLSAIRVVSSTYLRLLIFLPAILIPACASSSYKGVHHQPADLTYMQRASWEMLGWMNRKLESRLQGETSTTQLCRWHYPKGIKQKRTKKTLDVGDRGECKS